jgi:hypothetical protein
MPRTPITFPLSSNPARFGHAGAARLINLYPEKVGPDAKTEWCWWAVDGLSAFSTLTGGGGVRAMLALSDSDLYVVAGRVLFRVDNTGSASILGGISSDGVVTMAQNRVGQIAIVCDGLYYGVVGGVLSQLADPDLPPPISVAEINGQFVFLIADGRMFISDVDDWNVDALNFVTNEKRPDQGVRNITRGSDHVAFGTNSTEFWQDSGEFLRTAANDLGCKAAGSVVELEQTIFWVCHDGTVRVLEGYQGKKISTHPVERFIAEDAHPQNLTACAWQARGHSFYALSGTNGTWVYDVSTGQWHERASYGLDRWKVSQTIQFGTKVIAGNYNDGALYEMSPDAYDEDGDELVCTIQPAPVSANGKRVKHNRIDVDVIPGTGLVSGASYLQNPTLMVDYSEDGGLTFGTQRQLSTGAAGQTLRRCFATRLGMSRSRTYRLSMSAAVARGFLSMTADLEATGN